MKNLFNRITGAGGKPKTGLVLGSGAARGLAHIGVIKALREEGASIDMIAGTSIGALVGACYARKGEISKFEKLVLGTDWRRLFQLADLNLVFMFKGFVHGEKVKELLKTIIGDIQFKDLKIPLAVVAADVNTGEEVLIKEGSVIEAVRASISMPVIFIPVKFGDRFLCDGGTVNPLPVNVVKEMGAASVIACNVIHAPETRMAGRRKRGSAAGDKNPVSADSASGKRSIFLSLNDQINAFIRENSGQVEKIQKFVKNLTQRLPVASKKIDMNTPNMFDVLVQAIYSMEYQIVKAQLREADIVITPDVAHIDTLEFYRGEEAVLKGYEAARRAISGRKELKGQGRCPHF
ncbi:MAG: hypothetical protein DRP85_02540 [Candidatus Makaraimicrobium thalassicum]|nr:MAG: hypothetical protein DRP85_02540 [Candidatus Omnitrophota bacterium]